MRVLVTGGAGYIGSHTVVELLNAGHHVTVVDNLVSSSRESITRIEKITNHKVTLYTSNLINKHALNRIFSTHTFDAVIHFAGLKSVSESVAKPLDYYRNNIDSTLALCDVMQAHKVKKLIFSSSATVYGTPEELPLLETSRTGIGITNPYGQTKFMIERMLQDIAQADRTWQITILRYFNPIGAHPSGLIGEDPNGVPNNLFPYIAQVAVGKLDKLHIFGGDYDTPDGTGVRDYIHVVDLAIGHVVAISHLGTGIDIYNLGSGKGISVLEIIKAFEAATGKEIPYEVTNRRPGDIANCYADCSKAKRQLGWETEKTLAEACRDAWRWQSQNPNGYRNSIPGEFSF